MKNCQTFEIPKQGGLIEFHSALTRAYHGKEKSKSYNLDDFSPLYTSEKIDAQRALFSPKVTLSFITQHSVSRSSLKVSLERSVPRSNSLSFRRWYL